MIIKIHIKIFKLYISLFFKIFGFSWIFIKIPMILIDFLMKIAAADAQTGPKSMKSIGILMKFHENPKISKNKDI